MALHILTVKNHEANADVPWYFEDHAHFIRAVKMAKDRGIWVADNDGNPDIITDLDEFKNWMKVCYPDPVAVLREFIRALDELGFDEIDPISGPDTVDVVADFYDQLRKASL